jgi:uroporphyrinogen-III synthase
MRPPAATCARRWPAAVQAASALQPLRTRRGQAWFAVGAGTAAALRRAGISEVLTPQRMDSDGLLALPGLRDVDGIRVGIVTAPGGRDQMAPALRGRGAHLLRVDVYARVAVPLSPRAVAALCALAAPTWLALSSGEALQRVLGALPPEALATLRRARVVAASARLAVLAQTHGFADVTIAASAQPRDLLAAAAQARVHQQER